MLLLIPILIPSKYVYVRYQFYTGRPVNFCLHIIVYILETLYSISTILHWTHCKLCSNIFKFVLWNPVYLLIYTINFILATLYVYSYKLIFNYILCTLYVYLFKSILFFGHPVFFCMHIIDSTLYVCQWNSFHIAFTLGQIH